MIDEIKLFLKFNKIRKKGYIKSLRKGTTGAGYTFESLIGWSTNSISPCFIHNPGL